MDRGGFQTAIPKLLLHSRKRQAPVHHVVHDVKVPQGVYCEHPQAPAVGVFTISFEHIICKLAHSIEVLAAVACIWIIYGKADKELADQQYGEYE